MAVVSQGLSDGINRALTDDAVRVIIKAFDHDFDPKEKVTPFGIFLPQYDELYLYFTQSRITSYNVCYTKLLRVGRGYGRANAGVYNAGGNIGAKLDSILSRLEALEQKEK